MQYNPPLTFQRLPSPKQSNSTKLSISRHHVLQYNSTPLKSGDGRIPTISRCFLLSIPNELLTHITTFIGDPATLFALSCVDRRIRDLIADDNTWYRAFMFCFFGVGPDMEPDREKMLMLRRTETTWKKEYVMRFSLTRRWEGSRSATLKYQPHYWEVSGMHLLDNVSLMTANLQYGIVTRSFPLTGKILKGYLDASGTRNGVGIGNPNEEFSPNVTCIAMSSSGGTGRIAWGFRHGEVSMTSASCVMESNRSAARYVKCRMEDEHEGEVRCLVFVGRDDELLVSGCSRGQVKFWNVKHMGCLWTGYGTNGDTVPPLACVKIEVNIDAGLLVVALESGDIIVWWGFSMVHDDMGGGVLFNTIHEFRLLEEQSKRRTIDTLLLDPNSSLSRASILIHHTGDSYFIRLVVDLLSRQMARTCFGIGPLGPLTSFKGCFAMQSSVIRPDSSKGEDTEAPSLTISLVADQRKHDESSFVLSGDSLGRMCIWDWDAAGASSSVEASIIAEPYACNTMAQVHSTRKWEAHNDGAVCAIEVCGAVIVTASTRGTLKVWDSLTLTLLRSFDCPFKAPGNGQPDPVVCIIVRGDLLVASVGSRILVWQAGTVSSDKKGKSKYAGKPKGRTTGNGFNKWQQQIELNRDIHESRRLLEDERIQSQRIYGRERTQLSILDQLGLNENEAVEYILMLSREEDEKRRASEMGCTPFSSGSGEDGTGKSPDESEIGVFSLDEHHGPAPLAHSVPGPTPDIYHASEAFTSNSNGHSRSFPQYIPSRSNSKVQVLPPFFPGPTEERLNHSSPVLTGMRSRVSSPIPAERLGVSQDAFSLSSTSDIEDFPMMSSSSAPNELSSLRLSGSWMKGGPAIEQPSAKLVPVSVDLGSALGNLGMVDGTDAELRYVLELSLAEARSRDEAQLGE